MALVNSLYLRGAKQKLAGAVFYQQAGRTIARELASEVSNPRTPSQMGQRVKWANLVQFYKMNKGWMKKAFENKKATQSDYNKFMQMNVPYSRVYLTKQEAAAGACVVDAFRVTDGSLPPIQLEKYENGWKSDIRLGNLEELTVETTVATFSQALINFNTNIKSGDQLSFIRVTQMTDKSGVPRIQVRSYEMVVNVNNPARVSDFLPMDVMDLHFDEEGNSSLIVVNNGNMGAFAILVSRTTGSKTLVSTADLTLVNMDEFLFTYTNAVQLDRAMTSYGTSDDVFLDSDIANPIIVNPTSLSIMYTRIDEGVAMPNDHVVLVRAMYGTRVAVIFNKPVTLTTGDLLRVNDRAGHTASIVPSALGNSVFFNATESNLSALTADEEIASIEVVIGGSVYEMKFATLKGE